MKNFFLGMIAILLVVIVAVVAAWNVNFNSQKNDLSDVALANLEALADCEQGAQLQDNCLVSIFCNATTTDSGQGEGYYCSGYQQDNTCVVSVCRD